MSAAHLYISVWFQIKFSEVETEELRFGEQCDLNIKIRFHEKCCASHSHFQWMDLDCSSANHGVPHYAVCEKLIA